MPASSVSVSSERLTPRSRRYSAIAALGSIPGAPLRSRVTVMDFEASDGSVARRLLQALPVLLGGQPVLAWRRALPAVAAGLLHEAGFEPHPLPGPLARQRPCLLVRPLTPAGAAWRPSGLDPAELSSWDVRRVYGD